LEKMKMGAFLGVAQGSNNDPYGIHMVYEGNKSDAADNIWLIGKGITFDSGGLSLKPSFGMETMKSDMSGGAAVINAINAISKFKPNINVHALCLATENMPGGKAQRVGDVVTTMSGKTVEIMNTDAEGRLTLADAVEFAKQNGAKRIIDVATLTGAIVISLGHGNMGAFSNNEKLVKGLIKAGLKRGEPIWQLPLDDLSKKQNRSNIADIKNTGGRAAGSITAAHFIKEFVGEVPWVHLDIAGTAMKNSTNGWIIEGATGLPTRTLIQFVLDISNKS
jgi:leucyl aminopeptidase